MIHIHKSNRYIEFINTNIYNNYGLINNIFYSKNYGKFKILNYIETSIDRHKIYKIEFLNTNFKTKARLKEILSGSIKDKISVNLKIGSKYKSANCGYFIIDKILGLNKYHQQIYKIKFLDTGYKVITTKYHILHGNLKDPLKVTVFNIGYLGENFKENKKTDKTLYNVLIKRWYIMISRCYNKKDKSFKFYGAKGITVDKNWHNFSNYFSDVQKLKGFDRKLITDNKIQLDKDLKQIDKPYNERIYSKDTCIWLSQYDNNFIKDTHFNKNQLT